MRQAPVLMAAGSVQAPVRFGDYSQIASEQRATVSDVKPTGAEAETEKPDGKKSDAAPPVTAHWAPIPEGQEVRLRMAGMFWPHAADRIANAAYVTCESIGAGQVILFADSPTFRGSAKGTMRLLSNAAVLGPGMGTHQPVKVRREE